MKTNILYVHHAGELGGAPKSLSILLQDLDKEKYEPTVFMLIDGPAKTLFEKLNIKTIISKNKLHAFHGTTVSGMSFRLFVKNIIYFLPNIFVAYKIIKEVKPKIMHLNTTCLFMYAITAKLFFKNIKIISHVREPLSNNFFGKILKYFNRFFVDYFIPINEFEALPFTDRKYKVIKNSIDIDLYKSNSTIREKERKKSNFTENDFVIGYFARFNIENGVEDILKIAKRLKQLKSNVTFLIYGYEPRILETKVIDIANKMPDNVILKGMVKDVFDKMQAIDVLISPFKTPHFSRSIIEAQSLSIPIVATNVDSQKTLLKNNSTGFLYNFGDIKIAAEKILLLKENEELFYKMKKEARIFASQNFCHKTNNIKVYKIYKELNNK
jgi:glycosyltransferase involved in cell wall biosynthesis